MKKIYLIIFAHVLRHFHTCYASEEQPRRLSHADTQLYKLPNFDSPRTRIENFQHLPFYEPNIIEEVAKVAEELQTLPSILIKDYWNPQKPPLSANSIKLKKIHDLLYQLVIAEEYNRLPLNSICTRKHAFIIKEAFANFIGLTEKTKQTKREDLIKLYSQKFGDNEFLRVYGDYQQSTHLSAEHYFITSLWQYREGKIISMDSLHNKSIDDLFRLMYKSLAASRYHWKQIVKQINTTTET